MTAILDSRTNPERVFADHDLDFVVLTPADSDRIAHLVERCSERSRRFRFPAAEAQAPGQCGEHLARFDGITRFGLGLSATDGSLVAECRLTYTDWDVAEFMMLVRDDRQGLGLGTALLAVLTRYARLLRIRELQADLVSGNRAMVSMLCRYGPLHTLSDEGGVRRVAIALEPF